MGLTCFKSWKYDSRGQKGNRDVLASPGSYFFLSNSCGQGDEWLQSLNKRTWIPFTGVFGQRLEETVLYEQRYGSRPVPLVVEQCVHFIRERGLHEVGLFRCPGQSTLVKDLQEAFDAGERPSFDSGTDVHTVASLLKLYLRQLPEPLVPYSQYQDFLLCGEQLASARDKGLLELRGLLHDLPVANFNLLNYICQFLNEVQSYSCRNKMSCQNLATVFGPNILRAKAEDPHSIIGGAAVIQLLMLELIREHRSLFPREAGPYPTRAPVKPQAPVSPCPRQFSLPLIAERWGRPGSVSSLGDTGGRPSTAVAPPQPASAHWDQSPAPGRRPTATQQGVHRHRHTSSNPDSRVFPLPCSSSPRPPAGPQRQETPVGPGTGPHQPGQQLPGPQDPPPAAAAAAVPEEDSGGSSEYQEDSAALSAYDNLSRASLSVGRTDRSDRLDADATAMHLDPSLIEQEGAGEEEAAHSLVSSFSFSSCEVLPADETEDCGPDDEEEEDSDDEDDNDAVDEDDLHGDLQPPNSPASCSVPSDVALSTGSSEVFLSPGSPDPPGSRAQAEACNVHSYLAELKQQMSTQRAEYQATISRLERCNQALEGQMAALCSRLEQHKRWHSLAAVKIRNVERARTDADRRNATLQREMEQFFSTYGEARAGAAGRGGGGRDKEGGRTRERRTLQSL